LEWKPALQAPTFSEAVAATFGPEVCPREQTVERLFATIETHRVVHMRGTPASGKSEMLRLLELFIRRQKKKVVRLVHWPSKAEMEAHGGWKAFLMKKCGILDEDLLFVSPVFVLIDEAQTTYWDFLLWNEGLKTVAGRLSGMSFLIASSYGSPSSSQPLPAVPSQSDFQFTPIHFGKDHMVGLRPDDEDGSVGLFFSNAEFEELLKRHSDLVLLKTAKDFLYRLTGGHPGALVDMLMYIKHSPVSAHKPTNPSLAWERKRLLEREM
jgi:energy-coupling factor transporter ATP-binding protein EcfA2